MEISPLADIHALAEQLGISTRGAHRLVTAAKIPHYRVGGQLRFDIAEVLGALRVESAVDQA